MPSYKFLGLENAQLLEHKSPVECKMQLNIALPWPLSPRVLRLKCLGIDKLLPNTVAIVFHSLPETETETVEVLRPSGVVLTKKTENVTEMKVLVKADPKFYIPEWLVELAVKHLAFLIVQEIEKASQRVGENPAYRERMEKDEWGFYAQLKKVSLV